ncbi:EAL domain-containing protein [Chthonobacter rhizosphaerae]|uniref:EAL domain-containing protein n=1 Tax=Chthonobacter rhizosphaerae TaxID=2735553 RepID=UPI0015EF548F|nr:EAL domain-containing protein [Chthonobacter rhizosphaerae]
MPHHSAPFAKTADDAHTARRTRRSAAHADGAFTADLLGAFQTIRDGISLFGADGRLIMANARFACLYGLEPTLLTPGTSFDAILTGMAGPGEFKAVHDISQKVRQRAAKSTAAESYVLASTKGRVVQVTDHPLTAGGWLTVHSEICVAEACEPSVPTSSHDPLTGLLGRDVFRIVLDRSARQCTVPTAQCKVVSQFALVSVSLDTLGSINDVHGSGTGDAIMVAAAGRITEMFGDGTATARVDANEFAILVWLGSEPEHALARIDRLAKVLATAYSAAGMELAGAFSIGIALAPMHGTDAETLQRRAEIARRSARAARRTQPQFFNALLEEQAAQRRTMERDLRQAVADKAFGLVFQPIVDLRTGAISSAEALFRWTHPELGPVRPDVAIAIAEETGLIQQVGEFVLEAACRAARQWPQSVSVCVNVSATQLGNPDFVNTVLGVLARTGVAPNRLMLEVTETVLLENQNCGTVMESLSAAGVRFALDDFGTGYASMHYLIAFEFDQIKIDRSFVRDLPNRSDCQAIIQAVVGMGRALGKEVVVEGVETEEERRALSGLGTLLAQGFLFAPGLPGDGVGSFARLTHAVRDAKWRLDADRSAVAQAS